MIMIIIIIIIIKIIVTATVTVTTSTTLLQRARLSSTPQPALHDPLLLNYTYYSVPAKYTLLYSKLLYKRVYFACTE
jgi:hypothetical protein